MTPLQSHLLAAILAAAIAVGITYAILTDADQPEQESVEAAVIEERLRLRDETVDTKAETKGKEAAQSRISERKPQRAANEDKWADVARERVSVADSVLAVELVERINNWKR